MSHKNILLICGGGGSEHAISLVSAKFIKNNLEQLGEYNIHYMEITPDGNRMNENGDLLELKKGGHLFNLKTNEEYKLHFAIPCFHGSPGENGQIQAMFELMELPYLGCGLEASTLCFNKISTKLWFDALKIANAPYLFLDDLDKDNLDSATRFFKKYKKVYVKASSQGSSIGCYFIEEEKELESAIKNAFELSPYVLIENYIQGRELEIAVYENNNEIIATLPGEIVCPTQFYDFDQKYSSESKVVTYVEAKNISAEQSQSMKLIAIKAFKALKLKHLSRVDFFLSNDGEIYLNEINTFPGMTPISMFPKMMENNKQSFSLFLKNIIDSNIRK
jgi:D-alanine-D-alanine ligase